MSYDLQLTDRTRTYLSKLDGVTEKEKMGGLTFMRGGKLLVRIEGDDLLIRCEKETTDELLKRKGARRYKMKGRSNMKGWILVDPEGQQEFDFWMELALSFNRSNN